MAVWFSANGASVLQNFAGRWTKLGVCFLDQAIDVYRSRYCETYKIELASHLQGFEIACWESDESSKHSLCWLISICQAWHITQSVTGFPAEVHLASVSKKPLCFEAWCQHPWSFYCVGLPRVYILHLPWQTRQSVWDSTCSPNLLMPGHSWFWVDVLQRHFDDLQMS